jgi:hypothetical protein
MNEYNKMFGNTLDSIGTEISYSDFNSISNGSKVDNKQTHPNSQTGGVLNFLFGDDSKKKGNITELIMRALKDGNYEAVDFLLKQSFEPDLSVLTKSGDNLLHVLTSAVGKSKNAGKALVQLVTNKANQASLNVSDKYGNTPLHIAVSKGLNDLAELMLANGAKRNNDKYDIVTDYDVAVTDRPESQFQVSTYQPVIVEIAEPMSSQTRSIFAKPSPSMDDKYINVEPDNGAINDIVRAFRTSSDTGIDTIKEFMRTDVASTVGAVRTVGTVGTAGTVGTVGAVSAVSAANTRGVRPESVDLVEGRSRTRLQEDIQPVRNAYPGQFDVSNPVSGVDVDVPTEEFIRHIAEKLAGNTQDIAHNLTNAKGGGDGKNKRKKITTSGRTTDLSETKKIKGKRFMRTFSEMSDNDNDLYDIHHKGPGHENAVLSASSDKNIFGKMSENEMRKIARSVINQKDKFHIEALDKVISHMPNKNDTIMAKAVKAIIYDEIKKSKPELTGLDKAAELLKAITQKKVDEVLKQKDVVKQISNLIETKQKEREQRPKDNNNKSNNNTDHKSDRKFDKKHRKDPNESGYNFESSASAIDSDSNDSNDIESTEVNFNNDPDYKHNTIHNQNDQYGGNYGKDRMVDNKYRKYIQ